MNRPRALFELLDSRTGVARPPSRPRTAVNSAPRRTEMPAATRVVTDIAMKVRSGDSMSGGSTCAEYHAGVERDHARARERVGGRPVAAAQADLGPDQRARAADGSSHAHSAEDAGEVALSTPTWRRGSRR